MALKDSTRSWGSATRLLHWLMAALLIGLLGIGFYMVEFETDLIARFKMTQLHKSFGFVAFFLGLIRIGWRLSANARPTLPHEMKNWEQRAAKISHVAFYILMLSLPVSGWLMASASPLNDTDAFPFRVANMVFGLFELPDPFDPGSKALTGALANLHFLLALGLVALLLVHMAAAFKHAFVDRDNVLDRMLRG